MKPADTIQSLSLDLIRLIDSRCSLSELPEALRDVGITLGPGIMQKVQKAVELAIHEEIVRVKAKLKEVL